jgi:UDP-glucose 4-epimerase
VGGGFIGSHVTEALVTRQTPTIVLTRSPPRPDVCEALAGAEVVVADAREPSVLGDAVADARHVVFCAGALTPADSMASPVADLESTLEPLLAVLTALRKTPGVGVTYLSSGGTVYGEPVQVPIDEDHPTEPIVPYGIAKLAGEKYVSLYRRLWGVPGRILRCANVYGERQPADRNQGVVAVFLERMKAADPIVVIGDGSAVRDYLYVRDLADVICALLDVEDGPAVLNVGSGTGTSLRELIALLEEVTGLPARPEYDLSRPFDVSRSVLDISRLRRLLPYRPLPLRAGLERTWSAVAPRDLDLSASSAILRP